MDIDKALMHHLEAYIVEELLLEGETEYEYYIDMVAQAIDPTKIHIFLYTDDINDVLKYLTENGLSCRGLQYLKVTNGENSSHPTNNTTNCPTMCYRDMLYITISNRKEEYEKAKFENSEMEAITLDKIVKRAKGNGYKKDEILDLLKRVSTCLDTK